MVIRRSSTAAASMPSASPGWSKIAGGPNVPCGADTGSWSLPAAGTRSSFTTCREAAGGGSDEPLPTLNHVPASSAAIDPGPVAVGTWSGGRFMRFGEPLDDERFLALIAPDNAISTVITADVYGSGEADSML